MANAFLAHAFKEWSVICRALELGKQSLILRKGGIAETEGAFQLAHRRFWLFPTYTHQERAAIKPEAIPVLEEADRMRPPEGRIRLTHFAEATGVYLVHDLIPVLFLNHLHLWSEATVRARFAYRYPGLSVIPVRVFKVPQPWDIPSSPTYTGCRTWVELDQPLATSGALPVLADTIYRDLERTLATVLNPTAFA